MTKRRAKTYLRPLRRQSGLTQRELAFLIGAKAGTTISRIERLKQAPSLERARALALVFGIRAAELFPGYFSEIHEALRVRTNELYEELQGNPSKTTKMKLDFLEDVLARLDEQRDAPDV
jgi:transcriptional regulator with XRE-family HTH domain